MRYAFLLSAFLGITLLLLLRAYTGNCPFELTSTTSLLSLDIAVSHGEELLLTEVLLDFRKQAYNIRHQGENLLGTRDLASSLGLLCAFFSLSRISSTATTAHIRTKSSFTLVCVQNESCAVFKLEANQCKQHSKTSLAYFWKIEFTIY